MKIASAAAIRTAEQQLFAQGRISSLQLMDAVVRRLAALFSPGQSELADLHPARVVVYAGKGNNAGDAIGLAAALHLPVTLRSIGGPDSLSADSRAQLARIPSSLLSLEKAEPEPHLLILDGLLGSGARGPLRDDIRRLADELNTLRDASPRSLTLAIDLPTGLDAADGQADPSAIRADISCPIGCVKPGMLADGASAFVGRLLPVALPEVTLAESAEAPEAQAYAGTVLADAALMRGWLPRRSYDCFKNRAGRVAIVAGSIGMLGAAQLAAEAALQAGAGLVCLYCLPDAYPILAARVAPEIMVRPVESYAEIDEAQAQALLIGPGLGNKLPPAEREALHRLASDFRGSVVLDADGLNIAAADAWQPQRHWILTPHPGEMRRLCPDAPTDRLACVRHYRALHPATLLLKGSRSIIAGDEVIAYNSSGGPCMASGGQGDVLSGVIAALAAQGLCPWRAAVMGAWACGQAALLAQMRRGRTRAVPAGNVIGCVGEALAMLAVS